MRRPRNSFLVLMLLASTVGQPAGYVANAQTPVASLTKQQIRAIYTLRQQRWPDGTEIRLFVLPDRHPLHRAFVKNELQLFAHHLRKTWDRALFSGMGQIPRQVDSEEKLLQRLASTPGAIGYVSGDIPDDPGIKPIQVEK